MTSEMLSNNNTQNGLNNNRRFINLKLLINNLKQNKILLIITAIIMFFVSPLIEFLAILAGTTSNNLIDDGIAKSMAEGLSVSVKIATITFALILGLNVMRYIHDKKASIFYNSVPIKRVELFFTQFVTGLAYFIPALVLNYILSAVFLPYLEAFEIISQTYGEALLLYILCYSFTVFCANIAGTALNTLFAMAYFSAIIPSIYGICVVFVQSIFRFTNVYAEFNETTYQIITLPVTYYVGKIFARDTEMYEIPVIVVISALFIAGACILNHFTKTENAEKTFYFSKFQSVFKYSILVIISVAAGLIFKSGIEYSLLFVIIGTAIGGFVTFLIINFIIYRNIREVFKGLKQFGIVLVAVCVLSGVFQNDIFGVDKYLPNVSEVESISYNKWWNGNFYEYYIGLDNDSIPLYDVTGYDNTYSIILSDPEAIQLANNVFEAAFKSSGNDSIYEYYNNRNSDIIPLHGHDPINYNLKNGKTVSKKLPYSINFSNENDLKNYENALNKLLVNTEYKKSYYFPITDKNIMNKLIDYPNTTYYITIDDVTFDRDYGDVQTSSTTQSAEFINEDELRKIIDCINQDILTTLDLNDKTDPQHRLTINFRTPEFNESSFSIGLTEGFVNTLKYLNDNYLN